MRLRKSFFDFGGFVNLRLRDGFFTCVEVQQRCQSKVKGDCKNEGVVTALALIAFCEGVRHRKKSLVVNVSEI